MNTRFFFPPAHMQLTARKLCEELGLADKPDSYVKEKIDPAFEKLLRELCSLKEKAAEHRAAELKTTDLIRIIEYIPHNHLQLSLTPLVTVLISRRNTLLFPHLFLAWKKSCSAELTQIISAFYDDTKHNRIPKSFPITKELWNQWCSGPFDIPFSIANWICNSNRNISELTQYNISKSDTIYQAVRHNMILTCNASQLEDYSSVEICELLKIFSVDKQILFLDNFLNLFPDKEVLKKREKVYRWFDQTYGVSEPKRFPSYFWKSLSDDLQQKLKKWSIILDITTIFGNDERSLFWMDYIDVIEDAKSVYKCRKRENGKDVEIYQLALIFKNFAVIEFTEVGFAARAISRQHYDTWIDYVFNKVESLTNTQLRDRIGHNMPYDRIVHRPTGEWQPKAASILYNWLHKY